MNIQFMNGCFRISSKEIADMMKVPNTRIRGHINQLKKAMSESEHNERYVLSTYYQPANKMTCEEYWINEFGLKLLKENWKLYNNDDVKRIAYELFAKNKEVKGFYEDGAETSLTPKERTIEDDLRNENGQIVVSSRMVAERFGKRHADVIRAIEEKMEINAKLRSSNYYLENTYIDSMNRPKKEYLMTRDGFTFIVMGFTGKDADDFKMAYIEAFNKMEEALKNQSPAVPQDYEEAVVALLGQIRETKKLQLEVKAKEEIIQDLKPKSEYCERILKSKGTVTITVIAKDYGMSAKAMNQLLKDKGIQWKVDGTWVLRQKHAGKGYTSSYTGTNESRFGEEYSYIGTNWTQKGRMFIYEELKKYDILPEIEQ